MSRKIQEELEQYFLPWEQLSQNQKSDGRLYSTYKACVKKDYWHHGQPLYFIIKELPKSLATVYNALSRLPDSNLETVYCVVEDEDCCWAINEYITPPSCLFGSSDFEQPLTLETFLQNYHGSLRGTELSYDEKIRRAFVILLQLTNALITLHSVGFIHGDIHPGNILLTDALAGYKLSSKIAPDFYVKLIDFDNTKAPKGSDHTVTRLMGAKPYAAPEILDFAHPLDRADIYSLGCILYYAVYGKSPKDYMPDANTLQDKWLKRIFRHCTASYEARYRTLFALKKDILRALQIPSSTLGRFLQKLPGFRSRTPWKKWVAAYTYLSLLTYFGTLLFSTFQNASSSHGWLTDSLRVTLLFLIEILVVCDTFHLGDHFPRYSYIKDAKPFINYAIKATAAIILFFLYVWLLQYI